MNKYDVIHAVAAMLAAGPGPAPERTSMAAVNAFHQCRRVGPTIASAAVMVHRAADEAYHLDGWRGAAVSSLLAAVDGDLDAEDCDAAVMELRANMPWAFCRHCLRPVVDDGDGGPLVDDAPNDRAYCPKARNLTHARGTLADVERMVGT